MKTIEKYKISHQGFTSLEIPSDTRGGDIRVLSAGAQGGDVVVWAMIEPENPKRVHTFLAALDGQPFPEVSQASRLIGTVPCSDGSVVHVFHVDANRGY